MNRNLRVNQQQKKKDYAGTIEIHSDLQKSKLASKKVSLLLFIDLISKQNFLFYIKCFIAM